MTPPTPRAAPAVTFDAVNPAPMFDCIETAQRVWDYVHGALSPDGAAAPRARRLLRRTPRRFGRGAPRRHDGRRVGPRVVRRHDFA